MMMQWRRVKLLWLRPMEGKKGRGQIFITSFLPHPPRAPRCSGCRERIKRRHGGLPRPQEAEGPGRSCSCRDKDRDGLALVAFLKSPRPVRCQEEAEQWQDRPHL